MSQTVEYQTDSSSGPSLRKIDKTQGWVEYLNSLGQVYYLPHMDPDFYKSRQQNLIAKLPGYLSDTSGYIGWINHLAQQRLVTEFVMPVFGSIDPVRKSRFIQCGNSRVDACVMCGVLPEEIPMIAFSKSRIHVPPPIERLQSTQQFNDLFNLGHVDYRIVFEESDSADVGFLNSILRYTIYDEADQLIHHKTANNECKSFWAKFRQENKKYKIQIHGTKQTRSFIVPSDQFEIEYVEKNSDEWELSYGMMLGEFNQHARTPSAQPKLQLWLYDVTEPVYLDLMIPWMSSRQNFYKTLNEKAVIIDGANRSNGLHMIGNWVK
jgi:hypothetical protein